MSYLRSGLVAAAAGAVCLVPLGAASVLAHDARPPSGARPGECYGQVILPPVYGAGGARVLRKPAWREVVPGAPVVQKVERKVLVRPERVERLRVAPVYRTEVSWVTRPGKTRTVREPDLYQVVHEKVLIERGHSEWRAASAPLAYGERPGATLLQPTGEVVCRVWVPARYGHSTRKVLVQRGRTYQVESPAVRRKVVRKVLVSGGGWTERRTPALYRNAVVKSVVGHGPSRVVLHPAVYGRSSKTVLVRAESPGWARVVCGGQLAPGFVAALQQRLIAEGFDPGPPDGVATPQTYSALRLYQRTHRLAQGQVTVETARALGLL